MKTKTKRMTKNEPTSMLAWVVTERDDPRTILIPVDVLDGLIEKTGHRASRTTRPFVLTFRDGFVFALHDETGTFRTATLPVEEMGDKWLALYRLMAMPGLAIGRSVTLWPMSLLDEHAARLAAWEPTVEVVVIGCGPANAIWLEMGTATSSMVGQTDDGMPVFGASKAGA